MRPFSVPALRALGPVTVPGPRLADLPALVFVGGLGEPGVVMFAEEVVLFRLLG